jgi:predicted P-loop ATPase
VNAHTPIAGHASDDPMEAFRKSVNLERAHAVADAATIHREQRERDEPHQFDEPPFGDYPELPPFDEPQAIDRDAIRAARTPQEAARIKAGQSQQTRVPKKITRARLLSCLTDLDAELRFDAFANEPQIKRGDGAWKPLCDNQLRRLWTDSESVLSFLAAQSVFNELAIDEAQRNDFDPLEAYLTGLRWDGVARLDGFLSRYLGAEDTALNAEFGTRSLIGAVRRALQPGTKHDTMLVLEGPQGARKSSAVAALCPHSHWFTDGLKLDDAAREVIEQSAGKWIVEVAELGGMKKADVDNLKAMLSRPTDSARLAYGRQKQDRPRRFIMFGTVNHGANGYLKDGTGNRRFWICPVGAIDVDAIKRDRDQLWAEAVHRHRAGEQNWLSDSVAVDAETVADQRREDVPWADALRELLDGYNETTASNALAKIGVSLERQDRSAQMQVAEALKEIGFKQGNKQRHTARIWRRA